MKRFQPSSPHPRLATWRRALSALLVLTLAGAGSDLAPAFGSLPSPAEARKRRRSVSNRTFSNDDALDGPDNATGVFDPYPSSLRVKGMKGRITDVDLTLHEIRHSWPDDLQVLLVGPGGQTAIVMSGTGGGSSTVNDGVTLRLDDEAGTFLPNESSLESGAFAPTSWVVPSFPQPAPPGAGSSPVRLSVFDGTKPNGDWQLFVVDAGNAGYDGAIAEGWSLKIKTDAKSKNKNKKRRH
jgi:subtilisin-like proprotein convertase family protein